MLWKVVFGIRDPALTALAKSSQVHEWQLLYQLRNLLIAFTASTFTSLGQEQEAPAICDTVSPCAHLTTCSKPDSVNAASVRATSLEVNRVCVCLTLSFTISHWHHSMAFGSIKKRSIHTIVSAVWNSSLRKELTDKKYKISMVFAMTVCN